MSSAYIIYVVIGVCVCTEITWCLSCQHKLRSNNEILAKLLMLVLWIVLSMAIC